MANEYYFDGPKLAELQRLAQTICRISFPPNTRPCDAEIALLLAYCLIAEGVRKFPAAHRFERTLEVVRRASFSLVEHIDAVAKLSDAEVVAATSAPANRRPI